MTMNEIEETRIHPGDKYRPDGTFDLSLKIGWAILEDEETRKVDSGRDWWSPGGWTAERTLEFAVRWGAPEKPLYLAQYDEEGDGGSGYLNYEGYYRSSPVNAVPFLREWKAFVARAAHEFDWTMSAHSMETLSENEKWTVRHQMYGLISAPWILMYLLESTDPTEQLAGNYLWKTYQTSVEEVLTGLCHECEDIATFARRFAHQGNLELFRGALVQGKIYESDRDVAPWGLSENIVTQVVVPLGQTPTAEKIAQFHRQNRVEYLNALKFYDTDVGASERPHRHD